jgi:anti-sigma regulatory factor (Ser/Thr protein kinase)
MNAHDLDTRAGSTTMTPTANGDGMGAQALPGGMALTLDATADAPAAARHAVTRALAHWDADRREAALLAVSELVTNAVRHGSRGPADRVGVRIRRRGRATRIEVIDESAGDAVVATAARTPGEQPRSGWGLPIVAELTDRWGVERDGSRTCVWCELDAA